MTTANLKNKQLLLAGAAFTALMSAPQATAQETESDDSLTLPQVTVTATQRVESVQDVPIAVTALDPVQLERAGVADIKTLDSVAPSFNMNTSDTESGGITLRLRGVGTTGNNIGLESSVGVFLDGVYLSRPGIALADLLDLEQLEVLRGPQGTLFGRNTSAGALNVKTKKPDLTEFSSFANATFGNYALVNIQGGVNIPIIEDEFGLRISAAIRQRDGFVEGLNGAESHTRDRMIFRGQGYWNFANGAELRIIGDYADGEDECCHAVWFRDSSASPVTFPIAGLPADGGAPFAGPAAFNDYRSNDENFSNPFEQWGLSAEYNMDTPWGDLTYIGAYRDYEANSFRNTDFTSLDIFTVGASPEAIALGGTKFDPHGGTEIRTMTHELRLQNEAFDGRLDWLVGLYVSDEKIDARGSLTLLGEYYEGVAGGLLGGANILPVFSQGADESGDFATNKFAQSGESFSIFTHNVLSITDNIDLTIGLRYVDETKDGSFEQLTGEHDACIGTLTNPGPLPPSLVPLTGTAVALNCFVFAAPSLDRLQTINPAAAANPLAIALMPRHYDMTFSDDELVYTFKGSYKFNRSTQAYVGFTHGFKSGGFNLDASSGVGGADPRFRSEKIDAIEAGLKTDFWNGRARANIALFAQEMEDFQVLEFTGIQFQTFNVPKAESKGVEVETQAQLTESLAASLGVTYADAKYPNDCAPTGSLANATSLCGQPLTNSPEWVTILGATYERLVMDGSANFFLTGSMRHETERRTSTQAVEVSNNNLVLPGDIQEANTKLNLRAGLESENGRWAVEVWGNNITDERTKNVTFNIPLRGSAGDRSRGQFVQDPATYGVTLRTKF